MARKEPVRSTTSQLNIRLTEEQKTRLEKAVAKLVEGVPGGRVALSKWVLELALIEADRVLTGKR